MILLKNVASLCKFLIFYEGQKKPPQQFVLIEPFKMLQKRNTKCAGTNKRSSIRFGKSIIQLLDQKWINNVQIICGNSDVLTSSTWLVAMSYPSLYNVILEMEEQEEITLLLPQFRKAEVLLRYLDRSQGQIQFIWILN